MNELASIYKENILQKIQGKQLGERYSELGF
jgi:hypothetical protein